MERSIKYNEVKKSLKESPKVWLVTGCAGFIGSNLVETLLSLDQKVIGIDNFSTGYQHNLDDVKSNVLESQWKKFCFFEGDISDYSMCLKITKGIDIILHQAALGSVPRSIDEPINSNNSNVTGFLNILNAAKENSVKRFVYASSSSVYGDSEELPKVEEHTGNLLSPYAVTKYVNELYAGVFESCYDIEPIGLRYFNVFGKRQDPSGAYAAVIPKWIESLLNNESISIYGDGKTSRDFTYIENVIQANLLAGTTNNSFAFGKAFNVAVGGRDNLNELYREIVKNIKSSINFFEEKEPVYEDFRMGDIRHSNANIDKIKDVLGYEPTHSLGSGMKDYVLWYINRKNKS